VERQQAEIDKYQPGPDGYTVRDLIKVDTALFEMYARERTSNT